MLQSETDKTRPYSVEYARVIACSGVTRFSMSGTGTDAGQIGATFTIEINLYNEICQTYL